MEEKNDKKDEVNDQAVDQKVENTEAKDTNKDRKESEAKQMVKKDKNDEDRPFPKKRVSNNNFDADHKKKIHFDIPDEEKDKHHYFRHSIDEGHKDPDIQKAVDDLKKVKSAFPYSRSKVVSGLSSGLISTIFAKSQSSHAFFEEMPIDEDEVDPKSVKILNLYILVINAALGFFYMGYNLGVINTLIHSLKVTFAWDEESTQVLTSVSSAILPIGCLFGGFASGFIGSKLGRKRTLILLDILGIIGAGIAVIGFTESYLVGRFILGFAVGGFSTVVPVYIQEFVPKNLAGKLGMTNFCCFSVGVVVSFVIGLPLEELGEHITSENSWWRLMTLFPCIVNVVQICLLVFWFKIDTPFYCYIYLNKKDDAEQALKYIYSDQAEINKQLESLTKVKHHLEEKQCLEGITYSELFSKKFLIRLVVGIILNVGQQTSAINIFTFYSNTIYLINEPEVNATLYSSFLSFSELLGNFLAIFVIEKLGRRLLFLIGYGTVFLCLAAMTVLYFLDIGHGAHKFIVIFYYFFAGASTDPVVWILTADLLPEIGVGICATSNWITVIIVIFAFPYMHPKENFGLNYTFLFFSIITLLYFIFNFLFLKETKNKSYLQIEEDYQTWFGSGKKVEDKEIKDKEHHK